MEIGGEMLGEECMQIQTTMVIQGITVESAPTAETIIRQMTVVRQEIQPVVDVLNCTIGKDVADRVAGWREDLDFRIERAMVTRANMATDLNLEVVMGTKASTKRREADPHGGIKTAE